MNDPLFHFLYGALGMHSRLLEPTTNAGRYLRQLDRGDQSFKQSGEEIDPELECALRRVQITSRRANA